MKEYYLMHQNDRCGLFRFDGKNWKAVSYRDFGTGLAPFSGDVRKVIRWWHMREIPGSRPMLRETLRKEQCSSAGELLVKNLGVSLTDTYWACPEGAGLSYKDVLSRCSPGGRYDPNASLGGQMEKRWDLDEKTPVLVKTADRNYGQQAINEAFATLVHTHQDSHVPFVSYRTMAAKNGGVCCTCPAFTSDRVELVSAYEVVESQKARNDTSLYDHYIEVCVRFGIDREQMQAFMDYQTLTDFIISNTDEHLRNFGVLRDAGSMRLLGPAPIYDSGNSMFYDEAWKTPYTRAGMLDRMVTGFYPREEQALKRIHNRQIVRLDLLPSPAEAKEFFLSFGVPEWKADVISQNYATKLQLTKEFQHGKTISLYQEKQAERIVWDELDELGRYIDFGYEDR